MEFILKPQIRKTPTKVIIILNKTQKFTHHKQYYTVLEKRGVDKVSTYQGI